MHARRRGSTARWFAIALVLAGVSGLVASAGAAGAKATKSVTFRGYRVEVPASWPVIDLARNPSACVRFDVHAVYLGHPGSSPSCPVDVVGRTESLLLEPLDHVSRARVKADTVWAPNGKAAATVPSLTDHEATLGVTAAGVLVTASYGDDRATINDALSGATLQAGAQPTAQLAPAAATASVIAPGTFTGKGFDACTAPSSTAMQAWLSSAYRAVGAYIGGVNRGCAQPNLTASWVSEQSSRGWKLIPTYVGLQAPCTNSTKSARIDPLSAAAQGRAAADDAVANAGALGIGVGSAIYFDMEAYADDAACRQAVLTFLSNWTTRLHELAYLSGVYSSANSGIRDLVGVYNSPGFAHPDHVWFARWDGVATTSDTVIPGTYWPSHQRLKQYQGPHDESYGGVSINIDADYLDVAAGAPEPAPAPQVTSGDQVVTLGTEIHAFARGTNSRLYETVYRPGSGWSTWTLRGGAPIAGNPVAVPFGTGFNVFARGTDNRLYEIYYRPGSGWSNWRAHSGRAIAGDPAGVTYGTGVNVFARGTDNRLYEIYYRSGSGWSGWRAHGGASLAGDPAALVLGSGPEIHVLAGGTSKLLYETSYRSGEGWSSWASHAGVTMAGTPSVVAYSTGFNVLARGTNQVLYEINYRQNTGWSKWASHGGKAIAGDPAAMIYGTEIHAFARGADQRLSEIAYRPGLGWSGWDTHAGLSIAGTPTAVRYNYDIHVFARSGTRLYETYFRPANGWSGWSLKGGTSVPIT
jgi:hypothetical protein